MSVIRLLMNMGQLVEWELAEEIEVIGERGNLPNLSTIIPT
jgi:hypothetical protein